MSLRLVLLISFGFSQAVAQGALQLELGSDTLYACANEVLEFNPTVNGGTSPYSYLWQDGSTQANFSFSPQSNDTSWIWLEVADGSLDVVRDSVLVIAFGNCIWPGDMNGDGIANHVDLLEWGRAAGTTGPLRPHAHTNWIGQASPDWGHSLPGGHDYAYADANGDGIVHFDDIEVIELNYSRQNTAASGAITSQLPLGFIFPLDSTVNTGDTVSIPIYLGTANNLADSVYGIAMSFQYDNSLVKNIEVDFSNSWLGLPQQDLVGMQMDFQAVGQLDVSLTRIDQVARTGQGKLFDIIVTIDNIAGKNNDSFTLTLEAQAPRLLAKGRSLELLAPRSFEIDVLAAPISREPERGPTAIQIFPNPTSNQLIVNPGNQEVTRIQLLNMKGQLIKEKQLESDLPFSWSVTTLDRGRYYLRLQKSDGTWETKSVLLIE